MLSVDEISEIIVAAAMMTMPKCSKGSENLPTFRRNKLSPRPGYKTRRTPHYGILQTFSLISSDTLRLEIASQKNACFITLHGIGNTFVLINKSYTATYSQDASKGACSSLCTVYAIFARF